jgi:hypothetical protein
MGACATTADIFAKNPPSVMCFELSRNITIGAIALMAKRSVRVASSNSAIVPKATTPAALMRPSKGAREERAADRDAVSVLRPQLPPQ